MQIFIFKTNIESLQQVKKLKKYLANKNTIKEWSIDMEDCDKVLRIISDNTTIEKIIKQLQTINIQVSELE